MLIPLVLTLIAALAGIHLLTRVRTGDHGALAKYLTYVVLLFIGAILVLFVVRGTKRMIYGRHHAPRSAAYHHKNMHKSMHGYMNSDCCGMGNRSDCCSGMQSGAWGCGPSGMHGNAGSMHGCAEDSEAGVTVESTSDTVDGKIIHKEIRVIQE